MTEYIVNEVAEMKKLPKQDLYPIIFFIEEWDDEIILQIEKEIRLVYG